MNPAHQDITDQDIRAIMEAADEENFAYDLNYSGRGMFGRYCLAVFHPQSMDIARLFYRLGERSTESDATGDLPLTQEIFNFRSDNLGNGYVIYWPKLSAQRR